jgi:hypothetical protein
MNTHLTFTVPTFNPTHDDGSALPDKHSHKLGTSIGKSTHRKRSHHATPSAAQSTTPSPLQKLQRGSVQLGQTLASVIATSGHAQSSRQDERRRRASSVEKMKARLDRSTGPQGAVVNTGGLGARMGPDGGTGHRRRNTCSEDGRPHVCADDVESSVGSG